MKRLYQSSANLDKRAISKFLLSEEILMENAATALASLISRITHKQSVITIVCGSGDNGGDGYALARRLKGDYLVRIYEAKEPKSTLCKLQAQRAQLCGVQWIKKILPCDVVVDCLFGSGFGGELDSAFITLIKQMQSCARVKIACDIPSGIDISNGFDARIKEAFKADYTLSMGALKVGLFSDNAKDFVGEVLVGDLGLASSEYEVQSPFFLLEKSDLALPTRDKKAVHKGDFGHIVCVCGEKIGASILACKASLKMGVGKASLLPAKCLSTQESSDDSTKQTNVESSKDFALDSTQMREVIATNPEIMLDFVLPNHKCVLVAGMGLGFSSAQNPNSLDKSTFGTIHKNTQNAIKSALKDCAFGLFDADMCYAEVLCEILEDSTLQGKVVLTPHPKEFASLASICGILQATSPSADIEEVVANRFSLALKFSQTYPQATLLLKGANTIIANQGKIYINHLGSQALAKGGSGDVLCGVIAAFLAQGFSPIDSAINGSLAHALASHKEKNSYALTPLGLIEHLGNL
ncbi:NAD(P)H-hydrate epimerase [Helicobacter sp. T3_23-1059]